MNWIVNIRGIDYPVRDVEQLREWWQAGRIPRDAQVFDPSSGVWRRADTMPELRVYVAPPSGGIPTSTLALIGVVLTIVCVFILHALFGSRDRQVEKSVPLAVAPSAPPPTRESRVAELTQRMSTISSTTPPEEVVRLCDEWNYLGGIPASFREVCIGAYLAEARSAADRKNFERADAMTGRAETLGARSADLKTVRQMYTAEMKRVGAAARRIAAFDLTRTFASSLLKGWELKAVARGQNCSVLHVEAYVYLDPGMMDGLASGSLIYGRVLPGGLESYASRHDFEAVVITSVDDRAIYSSGQPRFKSRSQVRRLRRCEE